MLFVLIKNDSLVLTLKQVKNIDTKVEPVFTDKDSYIFNIDDIIVLEITRSAIPTLKIILSSSVYAKEHYKSIREQFDIEKMINDLPNKNNKIKKVIINSEVCCVNGKIVFQTSDLDKYKV